MFYVTQVFQYNVNSTQNRPLAFFIPDQHRQYQFAKRIVMAFDKQHMGMKRGRSGEYTLDL